MDASQFIWFELSMAEKNSEKETEKLKKFLWEMISISSRKRKLNSRNEGKLNRNNEKLIFQGNEKSNFSSQQKTTTTTRETPSYFVDGSLKQGLKKNQEIMTKSRRKHNENKKT